MNAKSTDCGTSLYHAAQNGYKDIVNFLLKNEADVTIVTNKGNTPLHIAT